MSRGLHTLLPHADVLCFSHARWDRGGRQRHLMARCARERRVFFVEEPVRTDTESRLDVYQRQSGLFVVVPQVMRHLAGDEVHVVLDRLFERLVVEQEIWSYVSWYSTPTALAHTRGLAPSVAVYDSAEDFGMGSRSSESLEAELLGRVDIVFCASQALLERHRGRHPHVHAFPDSVDLARFASARLFARDPADQAAIGRPRLGLRLTGTDRLDLGLLEGLVRRRPTWQIVGLGPVAETTLLRAPSLHWLGAKTTDELPSYLAGWDVAAIIATSADARTTPEYLAAGLPVVATPIRDVVRPWGELGLVHVAYGVDDFVLAVEAALGQADDLQWRRCVTTTLAGTSWDETWSRMEHLLGLAFDARRARATRTGRLSRAAGRGRRPPSPERR